MRDAPAHLLHVGRSRADAVDHDDGVRVAESDVEPHAHGRPGRRGGHGSRPRRVPTYWSVSVAALADPSAGLPADFDRLIVDKARASLAESVIRLDQQGLVMTGEPVIDPEVDSVTLGEQPEAHVIDCVDSTNWIPTFRDTGDPAASEGQNAVVEVEAWATVFDDRWVIREVEVHRDRPC